MTEETKSHPLDGLPSHYWRVYKYWKNRTASEEEAVKLALAAFSRNNDYEELKKEFVKRFKYQGDN